MLAEVLIGSATTDQFPAFENDGYTKRSGLTAVDFSISSWLDNVPVALSVAVSEIGSTGDYKITFTPVASGVYRIESLIDFNKDIWFCNYVSVAELTNALSTEARDNTLKIDSAPTTIPGSAVSGSLLDLLANKDSNKTYDPDTDSLEAIRDNLTDEFAATNSAIAQMQSDLARVLGLLHRNSILDNQTYDTLGQMTFARLRVFNSVANIPTTPGGSETTGLLQEYEINTEYAGLNQVIKFTLTQTI